MATCVGVSYCGNEYIVYAPHGLNDLFGKLIEANKSQIRKNNKTETAKR